MYRKSNAVLIVLVTIVLVISACSPAATPVKETEEPAATPVIETAQPAATAVTENFASGSIVAAGSSTVYPLAEAMAERFQEEGFSGEISISSVGSGAGFERFCVAGETDIANASRGIKDSEVESCAQIGRTPLEFRVGTDAIAIVTSNENDFLMDVTLEELGLIFSSSSEKWSDIRTNWPNETIQRFSPGTDSGTFDFFVEVAMGPLHLNDEGKSDLDAAKNDILNAKNVQFSEDDNVLVMGVEGSKYAIGYFGFAYFKENQANLKAISVDGIAPTLETAESGDYVLSRPLFIYSDAQVLKNKPQVAQFVEFFLTNVNDEIERVGYFPASQESLDNSLQILADALK